MIDSKRSGVLTRGDFKPARGDERRSEPRHAKGRPIQLLPCFAKDNWEFVWAELIDCSERGLGLVLDQPLKAGEQFLVKLRLAKVILLLYTVRHCEPAGRKFRVGAQFSGIAADAYHGDTRAILEALLAEG